jgi:hypothetical protein
LANSSSAGVKDGGVGGGEGEVADRGIGLVVENRTEALAAVDGLEDAAGRGADVVDARVGVDDGEIVDAAAHGGGSDGAEFEVFQGGLVGRLRGERGAQAERLARRRLIW